MGSIEFLQNGVRELTKEDLIILNGGSFAYDLGFFLRECVISFVNGGSVPGSVAVAADLGLNYKPLH
jgi:hypothetical protein